MKNKVKTKKEPVRGGVKAELEVSSWWLCLQSFLWSLCSSLLHLWKELYSEIALLCGERNTGRLGKRGGCYCLSVFFSSLTSPCSSSHAAVHTPVQPLWLCLTPACLSPSAHLSWCWCSLWQPCCFGNMLVLHMFFFFFSFPEAWRSVGYEIEG